MVKEGGFSKCQHGNLVYSIVSDGGLLNHFSAEMDNESVLIFVFPDEFLALLKLINLVERTG